LFQAPARFNQRRSIGLDETNAGEEADSMARSSVILYAILACAGEIDNRVCFRGVRRRGNAACSNVIMPSTG